MQERRQAAQDDAALAQPVQRLAAATERRQPPDERPKDQPSDNAGEGQGASPPAEQAPEAGDQQAQAIDDNVQHRARSGLRVISETEAQAEFAADARRAGLRVDGPPVMDGRLHRVPVEGDRRGKKSGAYIGHLDGLPAGFIRNFKTGETIRWRASGATRALLAEEITYARTQTARRQLEREQERRAEEAAVARRVRTLWRRAAPAYRHPYLERKGVAEHDLRVDASDRLLIPMHDADGVIWSMQTITASGDKLYEKGGRKRGMHILLGALTADTPLIIAEGFATAATLVEATGLPTVAAFDAGNLLAVAETYRIRNVGRPIIILAGDNDHHLPLITRADGTTLPNVGREKAEAAALAVNGLALIPPFAAGARGTDWNDYAALHGLDAVRRAVAEPLAGHGITLHPTPRETYMASRPPARAVQREAARRLAWRPPRAICRSSSG
jgi:phage/plasmid primase-like uncharacterized protein